MIGFVDFKQRNKNERLFKRLIDRTYGLGGIELIKITGTDTDTAINAVAENKSVIISGTFKDTISDFIGVFGLLNLNKNSKQLLGLMNMTRILKSMLFVLSVMV
jgi:hypothetical protein